jgi:hypothetical protein
VIERKDILFWSSSAVIAGWHKRWTDISAKNYSPRRVESFIARTRLTGIHASVER